jgi:FixJ family two-component response regulator
MTDPSPIIYIVDDDASVLRSLSRLVRQACYEPRTFSSGEEFLQAHSAPLLRPACMILDLKMPGLGGLELQKRLSSTPWSYPVIFISGNGSIPLTVQAMKQGEVTFLSKPFDPADLLQAIAEALEKHRVSLSVGLQLQDLGQRIERLTEREREVMAWVITGAMNKQIAAYLGIAEKTVKVHRARVMGKMRASSVAELVRFCDLVGFSAAGT